MLEPAREALAHRWLRDTVLLGDLGRTEPVEIATQHGCAVRLVELHDRIDNAPRCLAANQRSVDSKLAPVSRSGSFAPTAANLNAVLAVDQVPGDDR
jgi:hypothetical protein